MSTETLQRPRVAANRSPVDPDRRTISDAEYVTYVRQHGPCTLRDVSEGMALNHETVTQRMRGLARKGILEIKGSREGASGAALLYSAPELILVVESNWVSGESLESMGAAACSRMIRDEIAGALGLWARWVRSGRLKLNWHGDAHLALSLALDTHVGRLEPHLRGAVEFTHGVRERWGWARHDPHDAYDEALIELHAVYTLSTFMGSAARS